MPRCIGEKVSFVSRSETEADMVIRGLLEFEIVRQGRRVKPSCRCSLLLQSLLALFLAIFNRPRLFRVRACQDPELCARAYPDPWFCSWWSRVGKHPLIPSKSGVKSFVDQCQQHAGSGSDEEMQLRETQWTDLKGLVEWTRKNCH